MLSAWILTVIPVDRGVIVVEIAAFSVDFDFEVDFDFDGFSLVLHFGKHLPAHRFSGTSTTGCCMDG